MSEEGENESQERGEQPSVRPRRRKSDRGPIIIPEAPSHSSFVFGFCEDKNAPRRRKMEVFRPWNIKS